MKKYFGLVAFAFVIPLISQAQVVCPAGFSCAPVTQVLGCPEGYVCTQLTATGSVTNTSSVNVTAPTINNGIQTFSNGYTLPVPTSAPQAVTPIREGLNTSYCFFPADLTIGSSGQSVTLLQTWLISHGFDIPAISSGAQGKGYFSYQTAAALAKYQASVGISPTGYLGPQTRARLNAACNTTTPPTIPPINPTPPVACTADAKMCPDGSYVGRTGPSCQFAACPSTPTPTPMTRNQYIYWSGGKEKVQIGLVDSRYESTGIVLGWILLNGSAPSGNLNWNNETITDLTGNVKWQASSLSQGPFKIIAVSANSTGNYCTNSSNNCNYAISNYFTLASAPSISLLLPNSTSNTGVTPLSVTCYGSPYNTVKPGTTWSAQASGGKAPYQYAWSVYNDVSGYGEGSTQSASFMVNYTNSGTKQSVVRVTDNVGTSATATCTSVIPATQVNVTNPTATIDQSSLTSYSGTPTIVGSAYNVAQPVGFGVSISNSGGKIWGSGALSVSNNRWSTTINQTLSPGTYQVQVYSGDTLLTSGALNITQIPSTTYVQPLSATCFGQQNNSSPNSITWNTVTTGGKSPYKFAWSMYGDVSKYGSTGTTEGVSDVTYSTSGSKQAVNRVTDSAGNSVLATCSAVSSASAQAQTPTISSINPNQGPNNIPITVYGNNLSGAIAVNFFDSNGTMVAQLSGSSVNSVNSNSVTATLGGAYAINLNNPGTYQVNILTPYGISNKLNFTSTASVTPTPTPAPTYPTTSAGPTTTFTISSGSIAVGQSVTLNSTTVSPGSTLKNSAIDLSTDNVNWQSGTPCAYWSSPTGNESSHTIACSYMPTTAGTYYLRTRGSDNVGFSPFVYKTLVVSGYTSPSPTYNNTTASLSATCSGSAHTLGLNWSASASGGVAPYTYSWSMYGDVKSYPAGSTSSSNMVVSYNSMGSKQAVVSVVDSGGHSTYATCTGSF